jgi:phospholipid N-methyltransferase
LGTIAYLKTLIKDPAVASVTPSSRFAVERVCSGIDFTRARTIVEFGPGLGVFTEYLLRHMAEDAVLVAIERNPDFADKLISRLSDPRLAVHTASAEEVLSFVAERSADYVISGIPFSLIPSPSREQILASTSRCLRTEGNFITYQTFPPPASLDHFLRKPMQSYFRVVKTSYEFRNIPPLRIYYSTPLVEELQPQPAAV